MEVNGTFEKWCFMLTLRMFGVNKTPQIIAVLILASICNRRNLLKYHFAQLIPAHWYIFSFYFGLQNESRGHLEAKMTKICKYRVGQVE